MLAFGVLAMATSGFGQTFFIAVFGGEIRAAFGLSHTAYGTLYSLATVFSAALLLRAGTWADRWPLERVATVAVLLLALGCLTIGLAPHAAVLTLGFVLIRFGGQGLIAHLAMTTAGRYFSVNRGKAIAITATGIPLAEACLPLAALVLLGLAGWRAPWLVAAALLILVVLPSLLALARRSGAPVHSSSVATPSGPRHFTRREALRDPGLYMLLPAVLAAPFVVTAVLFHQAALAQARDWPLELVATAFTGFAAGHLLALGVAGPLVDRIGAHRGLALALIPMAAGLTVLAAVPPVWAAFVYLALTGMTVGGVATASGAIWPERYGTRYLGAIRAVAQAAMVVSTAVAPVLLGWLLDRGWAVATIGGMLATATVVAALLALAAPPPRDGAPPTAAGDTGR